MEPREMSLLIFNLVHRAQNQKEGSAFIYSGAVRGGRPRRFASAFIGPPPLRGSFFLENGTLRDTRAKNPEIGSKNLTHPSLF